MAMEAKHGIDISWLHHSHKDAHGMKDLPATPIKAQDAPKSTEPAPAATAEKKEAAINNANVNGGASPADHKNNHQHHEATKPKEFKPPPPADLKRKGSWITSLSSKFSSSPQQQQTSTPNSAPANKSSPAEPKEQTNSNAPGASSAPRDIKKPESSSPPASSPKSTSGSFLSSALRRLSSSSGSAGNKVNGTGGLCARKVMNVDPYRERCQLHELQPAKLRRVSFCVDVEIAGPARYIEDESNPSPPPPSPGVRRSSLSQPDKGADAKKKNAKLKEKAEGEALKRPTAVLENVEQEPNNNSTIVEEDAEPTPPSPAAAEHQQNGDAHHTSKKKEKKKRSEEERKERKEKKRLAAVANGTIPLEITRESGSSGDSTPGEATPKAQDRPTIDPLRIYRRCCQLRETPVLKRIAEQVSSPLACDPAHPGVLSVLDLSGFRLPLSDLNTLGDWLALVPVKRLVMEDCGLTDEAVRVILAGLLAVKTPDQAKFNKHLAKKLGENTAETERLGVIEKLSLKNNPKLTIEGWRHILLFIYMSRSLKAIDLSMIPFAHLTQSPSKKESKQPVVELGDIFEKSFATRLAGSRLEELVMAECQLRTQDVEKIVQAVITCGSKRLGLASNALTTEGLQAVTRFLKSGLCEGLDLGGNDLSESLEILTEAMSGNSALYALSLADCNISPAALKTLLPALVRLPNFRFIDLSHNRKLFSSQPNAIFFLRKYLPQMHALKRVHLNDVDMDPEHCIALAEVLPEIPYLAHIGMTDNPKLTALASAKDEVSQEEACAYYASLMAAVRVSKSIVSLDIEMPSPDSTELVKALGKQILAYALRNMERGPAAEAFTADTSKDESLVDVPDILLHLVGHVDGFTENHDNDDPAPSEDYIVSGTGVAKALGICLGNNSADRRPSRDQTPMGRTSGTSTPRIAPTSDVQRVKAKEMSKNLLESARKIRARLQPALSREASAGDESSLKRLQFLDSTLCRMIERFEEEYPECRPKQAQDAHSSAAASKKGMDFACATKDSSSVPSSSDAVEAVVDDEDDDPDLSLEVHPPSRQLSRHNSEVSLASRHLSEEEGRMHRFGQQVRRSILAPPTFDYHHRKSEDEEADHLKVVRAKIEAMTGEEIKEKVRLHGIDGMLREIGSNAQTLRALQEQDPDAFEQLMMAQLHMDESESGGPKEGIEKTVTNSSLETMESL